MDAMFLIKYPFNTNYARGKRDALFFKPKYWCDVYKASAAVAIKLHCETKNYCIIGREVAREYVEKNSSSKYMTIENQKVKVYINYNDYEKLSPALDRLAYIHGCEDAINNLRHIKDKDTLALVLEDYITEFAYLKGFNKRYTSFAAGSLDMAVTIAKEKNVKYVRCECASSKFDTSLFIK